MGRPSKKSRTLSKEEILKRALQLLDERGRKALSFRTLAREYGVTPMAIAHHVGTKEEMLSSIISQVYKDVGEVSEERSPLKQLRCSLARYCCCVLRHPQLAKCILENPSLLSVQLLELTDLIKHNLSLLVTNDEVDIILNLIIDYTHGFAISVAEAASGDGVIGPTMKDYLRSLDWILAKIGP